MTASAEPVAHLPHLPKADGSATFSYHGYTITSAVNGPIEAQRRDENAFEALVDVIVRPAAGVGGTAERQLENVVQSTLRQLIPIRNFPRCMIQVTLQVVETPEDAYANTKLNQSHLNLHIIPALLHAAVLGLLTAAVPMKTLLTATSLAVRDDTASSITVDPSPAEARSSKSIHALGFTSDKELLLAESEGAFTVEEWKQILTIGQRICCQRLDAKADVDARMADAETPEPASIAAFMRSVMETKTAQDLHWK